jgi:hypothetical protein
LKKTSTGAVLLAIMPLSLAFAAAQLSIISFIGHCCTISLYIIHNKIYKFDKKKMKIHLDNSNDLEEHKPIIFGISMMMQCKERYVWSNR